MHSIGFVVFAVVLSVLLGGCSPSVPANSDMNVTSKKTISTDDEYVAFRNAHENSPKIPTMIISLIKSHTTDGEYKLAEFYCNEYRRDFPSGRRRDEVEYLSINALYLNNKQHFDERLVEQINAQSKFFFRTFGRSKYKSKVKGVLVSLRQEQNARYEKLAKEYEAKGKPRAAEFYRRKIRN